MTVLAHIEADPILDPEKWRKVEPFWWVSSDRFEWRSWTWHVGTPPPTPQQESTCARRPRRDGDPPSILLGTVPVPETSIYWWRHPTYAEAVERQQRSSEATRAEWDHWMNYGSWTNLARLAPSRGYQDGLPGHLILNRWAWE